MAEHMTVTFSWLEPTNKCIDQARALKEQCMCYQAVILTISKLPYHVSGCVCDASIYHDTHNNKYKIKVVLKGSSEITGEWKIEARTETPERSLKLTVEQLSDQIFDSIQEALKDRQRHLNSDKAGLDCMVKAMKKPE